MRSTIDLVRNLILLTAENAPNEDILTAWDNISRTNDGLHTPIPPTPKRRRVVDTAPWYGQRFYEETVTARTIALTSTHHLTHLVALEHTLVQCLAEPFK
jgi:hypothetical protein